jgi:hypothetical protein
MSPPIAHKYRKFFVSSKKEEGKLKKLNKKNADAESFEFDKIEEDTYKEFKKTTKKYAIRNLFFPEREVFPINFAQWNPLSDSPSPDFKGNIYVLTNHNSASCSEYTIAYLKLIEEIANTSTASDIPQIRLYHIGENTNGAVSYFNPMVYNLPNSGIQLYFPSAYCPPFDNPAFKGEGCGWHPDYWTTNRNLLNTLIQLTGDKELKDTLAGLDKRML